MTIRLEPLRPGDSTWLVDQHGAHYAQAEGFDNTFGTLVADILTAFEADHDPQTERAWIAWDGDTRLGSIFCVRVDEQTAKLRLFYLHPDSRGQGLGRRLLQNCMEWARSRGYTRMVLWTHESHEAACKLYQGFGWVCLSSKPVRSFGVDLVEQAWEITL